MNVIVCIKRVPDTEARIRVDASGAGIDKTGIKYDMSPYDAFAVEAALRLKEAAVEGDVTLLTLGDSSSQETLRKGLAMGADRAVLLTGDVSLDGLATAKTLAAELEGADADLVLFGVKAADDDQQQVGPMVAALTGRPCVSGVSTFEASGGTATCHREVERSAVLGEHLPLLAHAASRVGDPQVRNRGTLGGSLVHGDPASDLPAVALAAGASMVIRGPGGERTVAAVDFFTGFLETAVGPDELLTEIRFPKATGVGWAFEKFNRRAQDWAIVGAAVLGGPLGGVALVNMASHPAPSAEATAALRSGATPTEVAAAAADGTEPPDDIHADPAYRRHLARVLVERAVTTAS